MGYKPSDFQIGVSEFVSVLLPGAVITYVLGPKLQALSMTYGLPAIEKGEAWAAFAVLAYLFGHLVFLAGSFLDRPYDWARQRLRPRESDTAYNAATVIKRRLLGAESSTMNTYKFATAVLALQHETAYAEVRQFEADSKFFRSLTVLGIGLLVAGGRGLGVAPGLAMGSVLTACAWRYVERRWKATQRAYQYVVVVHDTRDAKDTTPKDAARHGPLSV